MAENQTIARPYAEAVFKLALEKNALDSWQKMLEALSIACSSNYFMSLIKNSANSAAAVQMIISLFKDPQSDNALKGLLNDDGENFVRVIGENNRFEVIPEIYSEFVDLREKHEHILTVEFISARAMKDSSLAVLVQRLEAKYSCKVKLIKTVDPSIIGGAVLKIGDEVLDASVRHGLTELASSLRA